MTLNCLVLIKKVTLNKTKHLLVENELKKSETFYSIYFCGKNDFEDDGTQNHLVFQTVDRCFKTVNDNDSNILPWKYKGLFDESVKPPSTPNKMLNFSVDYIGTKARVKFD